MPRLGSTLNEPKKRSGWSSHGPDLVGPVLVEADADHGPLDAVVVHQLEHLGRPGRPRPSTWGTSLNMYWAGNS